MPGSARVEVEVTTQRRDWLREAGCGLIDFIPLVLNIIYLGDVSAFPSPSALT